MSYWLNIALQLNVLKRTHREMSRYDMFFRQDFALLLLLSKAIFDDKSQISYACMMLSFVKKSNKSNNNNKYDVISCFINYLKNCESYIQIRKFFAKNEMISRALILANS